MSRYVSSLLWAAGSTLLDQVTKLYVLEHFPLRSSKVVVPNFFNLVHVHNKGTAWGILNRDDITWQVPLFISITVVALGFIGYMLKNTEESDRWMILGLGLVGGGAVGNLIDRVRLGEVVDFLDFYIGSSHWPAFNIADASLTIGAIAILISMYLHREAK